MGGIFLPFVHLNFKMKTHKIIYFSILILICTNVCAFTINGTIHDDKVKIKTIYLYKWHNSYYQELIADIPVYNGAFTYSNKDIREDDTYMISNPLNNQFMVFVFDADIIIKINSLDLFHNAQVINSPLTEKLHEFNKIIQDSLYNPIRKLETLIQNANKLTTNIILDSLNLEREKYIKLAIEKTIPLSLDFVKKNPNSFISLFILTKYGMEAERKEYRECFDLLNDSLKRHSRAKIYNK
jgi:hypothetical protein